MPAARRPAPRGRRAVGLTGPSPHFRQGCVGTFLKSESCLPLSEWDAWSSLAAAETASPTPFALRGGVNARPSVPAPEQATRFIDEVRSAAVRSVLCGHVPSRALSKISWVFQTHAGVRPQDDRPRGDSRSAACRRHGQRAYDSVGPEEARPEGEPVVQVRRRAVRCASHNSCARR
jgi:hypothetical protein